jgi:hypothetical protein
LRAQKIYVRTGELIVGYEEKPFANKATISLMGGKLDANLLHDDPNFIGNKLLANVGNVTMIGKKRTMLTRL